MLLILLFAVLCAHISCGNSNQLNDLPSDRNARGVQVGHELNSEFKGNIPIHFEYGSHNRDRRHPQTGGNSGNRPCPRRMPNVKNAKNRCRGTNCQAQCDKGFELPNGENTVKMQCKSSEWILEGFGKNDKVECKPKSSCPSKPDIQQAETTDCGPRECTVNCSEGHSLPDGSTSMKLICKNEKWEPADSNVSFLPHCESTCESGRVFKECSRENEKTCDNAEPEEEFSSDECIQGCFCPDGTVEHDGNCIQPENCPTEKENSANPAPSKPAPTTPVPTTSVPATKPTPARPTQARPTPARPTQARPTPARPVVNEPVEPNPARCEIFGDPHYRTFDGKRFDFMGKCSYYLMKMDSGLDVIAENGDCPPGFSKEVSCLKSLTMQIPTGYGGNENIKTVCLKQGGRVDVNGAEQTHKLPMNIMNGFMHIRQIGQIALMASFGNGMQMVWDGSSYAYIDAPGSQSNRTAGLCGNFDGNPENDLTTPNGKLQQSPETFGYEWRVKKLCDRGQMDNDVPHPCQMNRNGQQAQYICSQLTSQVFAGCNVDRQPYIQNCIYDMCASKGDVVSSMCTIFAAFANECSRNGTPIKWRETYQQCEMQCPSGQIYEECSRESYRSCADLQRNERKQLRNCIAGCRCPEGMALDENKKCIPIDRCPCMKDNLTYNPGYQQMHQRREGFQTCTCKDARWDCEMNRKDIVPNRENVPPIENFETTERHIETTEQEENATTERPETTEQITEPTEPTERDVESTERNEESTETEQPIDENTKPTDDELSPAEENKCMKDERKRISICLPIEPKTCKNMNNYRAEMVGECKKGCVCKDGYVLDEVSNACVEPTECSCENEGKNYANGDRIKKECNDCICQSSEWYCTNRKCNPKNDDNDNTQQNSSIDKRETDAAPTKQCQPFALSEPNTVGLVRVNLLQYGKCENKEPIRGLTVCRGSCATGTQLNPQTFQQEQQCTCCTVTEEDKIKVPVNCETGNTLDVLIPIAKSCACQSCSKPVERESGSENSFGNTNMEWAIPKDPEHHTRFTVLRFPPLFNQQLIVRRI